VNYINSMLKTYGPEDALLPMNVACMSKGLFD
jgi:hypothetical protein